MIEPHDIKQQVMCLWDSGAVLRAWLGCEQLFPLVISAGEPTENQLVDGPESVLHWKKSIEEHCQCHSGHGYRIEYTEIDHAHAGRHRLPAKLVFDQVTDLIAYIGKGREVKRFAQLLAQIRKSDARLLFWCEHYPLKVLDYEHDWEQLFLVLDYLKNNPAVGLDIEELEIPLVEREFLLEHHQIITQLLNFVLPGEI